MAWTLLTNDDGIESPALFPFARALQHLGDVRIAAPDSERSWISKAITRYGDIQVRPAARDGIEAISVSGYPADAVQIGATYWDEPPGQVVSGINLGYNHGAGYVMSSGTVGAAIEGWELGIPSIAFSVGSVGTWNEWHRFAWSAESAADWERLAELCVALLVDIRDAGLEGDVINVNVPWEADHDTARRLTTVARVAYGSVHRRIDDLTYRHDYREDFKVHAPLDGTDVGTNQAGEIAITPIMMPHAAEVTPSVRAQLERKK